MLNINISTETQLTVTFNPQAQQLLLEKGFDNMSIDDKNSLIAVIANNENLAFSDITPDYILNYHKSIKKDLFNSDCESAIVGGFKSTNGHTYTLDRDDQLNMMGQKDELLADSTITIVSWKTEDAGMIDHQRDDWLNNVYAQAFTYKKNLLVKCMTLKAQVDAATTHDAIIQLSW